MQGVQISAQKDTWMRGGRGPKYLRLGGTDITKLSYDDVPFRGSCSATVDFRTIHVVRSCASCSAERGVPAYIRYGLNVTVKEAVSASRVLREAACCNHGKNEFEKIIW
jgi:hypothetical protein